MIALCWTWLRFHEFEVCCQTTTIFLMVSFRMCSLILFLNTGILSTHLWASLAEKFWKIQNHINSPPGGWWVDMNFGVLKKGLNIYIFYSFLLIASPRHVPWNWHKKNSVNECDFLRNLEKPQNPYQLTPVYGIW